MDVQRALVTDARGNIILKVVEDNTALAKRNQIIRENTNGWTDTRQRKMLVSVPPRLYYYWARRLGEDCWKDRNFIRSFLKEHPWAATCDPRGI